MIAACGQIIEALIKHRLIEAGYPEVDLRKKSLGALIVLATNAGILQVIGSNAAPTATLSSARILRNWSSHYSTASGDLSDYEAAQALVLLIAISESLYPTTVTTPPESKISNWSDDPFASKNRSGPSTLILALENLPSDADLPKVLLESPKLITDYFAVYGTGRAIARLERFLHERKLPRETLKASFVEHYAIVIRNASYSSYRTLIDLIALLRRLDLDGHAAACGILLQSDLEFLTDLVAKRSPAYVARYLMECFNANREVFFTKVGNDHKRALFARAFWMRFAAASGNILNAANILAKLPPYARAELLIQAPLPSLLEWIESSNPLDSSNLLSSVSPSVLRVEPNLAPLRDRIVNAIARSTRTAQVESLARLPLRLRRIKATDTRGTIILKQVLERVEDITDWSAARRILWDTYSFFPDLMNETISLAESTLGKNTLLMPPWEKMCLRGMLYVAGVSFSGRPEGADEKERAALIHALDQNIDRWQIFLGMVGVGIARGLDVSHMIPHEALNQIKNLLGESAADNEPGARLLLIARQAVGIQQ